MAAQEKTESATPKRRQETREKGQVARSPEIGTAVSLLVAWITLKIFGQGFVGSLSGMLSSNFQSVKQPDMSQAGLESLGMTNVMLIAKLLVPITGALLLAGLLSSALQVGLHFTPSAAKPQVSRINPASGFKRLFSMHALEELGKALVKMSIVGVLCYQAINGRIDGLIGLTGSDVRGSMGFIGDIAFDLLLKIGLAFLVMAAADYAFQRWQFEKNLKMTKQEVKEEMRGQELNEQIKTRIRSLQRAMARKRMMQHVPQADVVITNPTHYAVALKYDASKMKAPLVVAKGQRLMAQQIKTIARAHGIPLVENKPLAQALYKAVEVDREIPRDLYKAVAEVLAFIYRLKQQRVAS